MTRRRVVLSVAVAVTALALALVAVRPAPPRPAARPRPVAAPAAIVTRSEHVETTVAVPELGAELGAALAGQLGRATRVEEAIADARAGRIDPVELGLRLHDAVQGRPELGHGLLGELVAERSPEIALQLARSLATLEDDATLREETVERLRAADGQARAVGLLALMGRGEAEVVNLAADSFAGDVPAARATAGFLLNNAPADVPAEALAAARAVLADGRAEVRLREEAATLLGRPDAGAPDLALLEATAGRGEVSVRARALAALEASGMDRARLRAIFARVAADPASGEALTQMAGAFLATRS